MPNSANGERGEVPSRGRVRSLPGVAENRTQKTAATPELHFASRRLAVAPRPSHTTALRFAGERTGADERLGERGAPGEGSARSPVWQIIVNTWKPQYHCNSVCIIIGTTPIPEDDFCWDFFEMYNKMTASSAKLDQ